MSPVRRVSFLGTAIVLAASLASAQSTQDQAGANSFSSSTESSSQQFMASLDPGSSNPGSAGLGSSSSSAALPSAPSPSAAVAGQETSGGYSGWKGHDIVHRLTFEASGGFNAPAGDKSYITWGGQFTVGGGVNFSKRVALLAEYQFIDDKLPGHIIAEAGAQGGHVHLWSLTLDPVVSLFPKSNNDVYVTGGYGFYRKVTSFTDVEPTQFCYFYCGIAYTNQVVGHFSSNQGGFNIGGGYQHRLGGMYGDSKMRLFAEVRFVDALTPAVVAYPNGLAQTTIGADTKVIPVSFGVRW
jgi:hypothetical protein